MSAALFKKSLAIVDEDFEAKESKKKKKNHNIVDLIPESQRIIKTIGKKGEKIKHNVLKTASKLTLFEAQEKLKSANNKSEENLKKILMMSSVSMNKDTTNLLIKRAQTGKYVISDKIQSKDTSTVFTEDDFANFEQEYLNS